MLSKSEIKNLQKLHSKKGRDRAGAFLVEGEKLVKEAIDEMSDDPKTAGLSQRLKACIVAFEKALTTG